MATSPPLDLEARAIHWHAAGVESVAHHVARFDAMVRSLDADQLDAPVPGMAWTTADVVAHVASVWRRYTVDPRRADTWDGVAEANASDLELVDRDIGALLDDIAANTALMALAPEVIAPQERRPFHAGQTLTLAGAWGNAIDELLVHGDDIARATGAAWTVDAADLEPFWRYTMAVMPGFLNERGRIASDRWTFELGFDAGPVRLRFDAGDIRIDEPGDWDPDHVVDADPVALTLAMPWRRRKLPDPAVAILLERFEVV